MSKPADPKESAAPPPATLPAPDSPAAADAGAPPARKPAQKGEIGGPAWPEPTRYGDWERNGRVSDF
jgi:homeobox protein ESX1